MQTDPRRPRTPKIKEFVREPFIRCPDCGTEGSFGVLMIENNSYMRRCVHCWFDQVFPLPKLRKKRIYLDQFVVSNMMKELDPDRSQTAKGFCGGIYLRLFEKLDRLSKLQLIVCPDSSIQEDESVVDTRHNKLRSVFRHLSHGVSIDAPEQIYRIQLSKAFRAWRNREEPNWDLSEDRVYSDDVDGWKNRIRIEINLQTPGLAEELKASSAAQTRKLHAICCRWQSESDFSFAGVVNEEIAGFGRSAFAQFERHVMRLAAMRGRVIPFDPSIVLPSDGADLIAHLLIELTPAYPDPEERLAQVRLFFASEHFRSIPYIRITALFWATLARNVRSGRNPENFPRSGMFNDIAAVSAFAPYCDAMFVDKEVSHLAGGTELRHELQGRARLYSLRGDEARAFLDYLDQIESEAPQSHLELVEHVYGPDWPTPFLDLLKVTAH